MQTKAYSYSGRVNRTVQEELTNWRGGSESQLKEKGPCWWNKPQCLTLFSLYHKSVDNVGWRHYFIRGAYGNYIHIKALLLITHTRTDLCGWGGAADTKGLLADLGSAHFSPCAFLPRGLLQLLSNAFSSPAHRTDDHSINAHWNRSLQFQERKWVWWVLSTIVSPA